MPRQKSQQYQQQHFATIHFGLSKDLKSTVFQHKVESLGIDRIQLDIFPGQYRERESVQRGSG